jgi:hypothetical protein
MVIIKTSAYFSIEMRMDLANRHPPSTKNVSTAIG